MGTADRLRARAQRVWRRNLEHPFVRGMGDGSLAVDRFVFYLQQDYLFLIEYSRALAIAAAKAPDLEGMGRFAGLLQATLNTEMDLHRQYCAGFGVSPQALERTAPAPATVGYTGFLVSAAYEGSPPEIVAAMLPCQWGYAEIGLELARSGDTSRRNRYAWWIKAYAAEEFQALAKWMRGYLERLEPRPSMEKRRRLERLFLTGCRYEYLFWEMGWRKETWPT